jgi:hypothetical protein
MLGEGEALARQVDHDGLAHARHVVGQRRAEAGREDIDRTLRKPCVEQLHDRMAADEIADPHVGHDQNRLRVRAIVLV